MYYYTNRSSFEDAQHTTDAIIKHQASFTLFLQHTVKPNLVSISRTNASAPIPEPTKTAINVCSFGSAQNSTCILSPGRTTTSA